MTALDTARLLRRTAFTGIGLAVLLLAIAPFLRPVHDLVFWLVWPLLLASLLIVLGIAAHLLFDVALFRLIESGSDDVDDILERMGLRTKPALPRPLGERIAGSRRICGRMRFFLVAGAVLSVLLALLPSGAGA